MGKFKVGDEVVLVNGKRNPCVLKNGVTGVVLNNNSIPFVQFNVDPNECLHDAVWFHGKNGKCWAVCENELSLIESNYKKSNRYKLREAVKKTGHAATHLSLAADQNQYYFGSEMKESRFNSRGDLNEKQFNKLLTNLAFAERKLNGVPAKVVDNSIDIETESLCIEKRFELVPETVAPVAPIYPVRNNVKPRNEVNKSIVCFILLLLVVIILMLVAGIYKSIF